MKRKKGELWEWLRSIIVAVILAFLIRMFVIEIFLVEGNSMYPVLKNNERLIVNKFIYRLQEPERDDIVVFRHLFERDFIKRIAAVEGDLFEIRGGQIFVNGIRIEKPWLPGNKDDNHGPVVVPPGYIFVLGDNRANSMDSRDPAVGFIPLEKIKGRAFFVFWPLSHFRLLS